MVFAEAFVANIHIMGKSRIFNMSQIRLLIRKCPIVEQNAGVKMTPNTKIDLNSNRIAHKEGLDDLARILFPGNKNQQRVFLAVFVELKWAPGQFLPTLDFLAQEHGISLRTLETVISKMRRLGLIDHVSRFNKRHGYREGWVFSRRFELALHTLSETAARLRTLGNPQQERKDRDIHNYL